MATGKHLCALLWLTNPFGMRGPVPVRKVSPSKRLVPQAHALLLFTVVMCHTAQAQQQQMMLRLERADSLSGRWSEIPMSPEMLTNGRVAAGPITNNAGFWRMKGEMVTVVAPAVPSNSLTVPRDVSSIQAAVDALTNGGTVFIASGVYTSPITITGKYINLIGLTNGAKPVIRGAFVTNSAGFSNAPGLINYGPNSGGAIMNMLVSGGDTGIRGFSAADPRSLPPYVTLSNVSVANAARGISGGFAELNVFNSAIVSATVHSVSIQSPTYGAINFADSHLGSAGSCGLRVESFRPTNNPLPVSILKTTFTGNGVAGAVMIGPIRASVIAGKFVGNGRAGFWCNDLATSDNVFWNSLANGNDWGLVTANSGVIDVFVSDFVGNRKSGIIADKAPAGVVLGSSTATGNFIGIIKSGNALFQEKNSYPNTVTNNTDADFIDGDAPLPVPGPSDIPPP